VAYNPVTGQEIRVGVAPSLATSINEPVWLWVCADDGGVAGAYSLGTATYLLGNGYPAYVQHVVLCPAAIPCSQYFVGAALFPAQAGAYGATPCLSPVVSGQPDLCVSAGVTPGPAPAPVTTRDDETCRVNVAGTCATKAVAVQIGGTLVTLYFGSSPIPVTAPAACARTNWADLGVTVRPDSDC
jgi:hypothetical protein